ncbi:uncharacterized protein BDR25DRAFT_362317 [Lindgomyces ingoldianus]|uniref:Uncharacterized protein n=1 Tax=Lindgomyces ingoldianus TaxID=673940 RepID=A0ACB6QAF7_9PLEO|nr:uncharacterized protein BDR25DRAFT_362317 [Lindgomyces ingoldianus]KAF2463886.1 hypothetical protein BDR25DRAFT_362317 [Lindgomyces ingoldianus]
MLQAEQKAEQHDPETVLQSDTWIRVLQGAHRTFHRRNSGGGLLALNSRGTMLWVVAGGIRRVLDNTRSEVLVFAQEIII